MEKYLLKRMLLLVPGIGAVVLTAYAQNNPEWTEQVFSRSVYPMLSSAVGFLPSLVGFSVAEWLLVLFVLLSVGYIIYYVRTFIVEKDDRGMVAYRGLVGAIAIVCVLYFSFTVLCGLNYYRYTFASYTGYDLESVDHNESARTEQLERLCTELAQGMDAEREQLGDDADLYYPEAGEFEEYARQSVTAVQMLAKRYPVLDRPLYSTPKPVVLSGLMSDAGIGGVFVPFTMESNINTDTPFFTTPSTMAHELAHQCGFMREDEANFIAYLACMETDDPLMRYSGYLLAFDHSISALRKVDPESASKIMSGLSQAVQHDMEQRRQFWTQHDGVISDISHSANDVYLKANSQADGVSSYGRMVELLLAERMATA